MSESNLKMKALAKLTTEFFDSHRCDFWLVEELHPAGYRCPQCAEPVPAVSVDQFFSQRIVQCRACRKQFSARTETPISGCHFSSRELFALVLLHEFGRPLPTIAERLSRDRGTCYQVLQRLRK